MYSLPWERSLRKVNAAKCCIRKQHQYYWFPHSKSKSVHLCIDLAPNELAVDKIKLPQLKPGLEEPVLRAVCMPGMSPLSPQRCVRCSCSSHADGLIQVQVTSLYVVQPGFKLLLLFSKYFVSAPPDVCYRGKQRCDLLA